jgi:hypothetical protein
VNITLHSTPFSTYPSTMLNLTILADLEMSVISNDNRPIEVLTSDLWSTHLSETGPDTQCSPDAFSITVHYIVQILNRQFETEDENYDLASKLKMVSQRISAGYTATVRRLELELLQAGKSSMPSPELFDEFIPQVRGLCDPIYSQRGFNARSKYHALGVDLIESLIHTLDNTPTNVGTESFGANDGTNFSMNIPEDPDPLEEFLEDLDKTFINGDFIIPADTSITVGETEDEHVEPTTTAQHRTIDPSDLNRIDSSSQLSTTQSEAHSETIDFPTSSGDGSELPYNAASPSEAGTSSSGQKTEANSCCEICGYRPKGDPQWFKGSMAKHRKLQHSTEPPKVYKCPYPGCTSAYKNRPDNLRQHQIEKGHFVDGVDGKARRSSKRKKPAE